MHSIRRYQPSDRARVRQICADTGFLGKPIDPVFEDRELFADFLTAYYTDKEPESTFICEMDGEVMGYLMSSRQHARRSRFQAWHLPWVVLKGLWRGITRPYKAATWAYVKWLITRGGKETPQAPENMPHFHINLLEPARNVHTTKELIQTFINYLADAGEKGVYGQMVTFGNRRGERMFARYGFKVMDKKEVTKYRALYPEPVYLYTVVKDLQQNRELYGADLVGKET